MDSKSVDFHIQHQIKLCPLCQFKSNKTIIVKLEEIDQEIQYFLETNQVDRKHFGDIRFRTNKSGGNGTIKVNTVCVGTLDTFWNAWSFEKLLNKIKFIIKDIKPVMNLERIVIFQLNSTV